MGWGPSVLLDLVFLTSYASLHPLGHFLAHYFHTYLSFGLPGWRDVISHERHLVETPGDNQSRLASLSIAEKCGICRAKGDILE